MRLRTTLAIASICLCSFANAQSFNAFKKEGDKAFAEKDYYTAMKHYQDALELRPDDASVQYQFAEVARQFYAYEAAEKYYTKVLKSTEAKNFLTAHYRLGLVCKSMGQYSKAVEAFEAYLQSGHTDASLREKATAEIENCQQVVKMLESPLQFTIAHLDKKINTPYSEFGALLRNDSLYYSSYRYDFPKDKHRPGRKISKLLLAVRNGKGQPMRNDFNADTIHIAHTAFSMDGSRLYFTRCRFVNTTQIRCELCYREKDKRKRWKVQPVVLPEPLNMKDFTSTQPSIGYDSTLKAEVLYFVSDRPGGKGGLDVWRSKIEAKGFGAPENIASINTAENEASPFFHTPSQSLYFSSEGYTNFGGYDIFKVAEQGVENIGAPFNTSYNDLYFSASGDGKSGYLSSNRLGSMYLDKDNKACCNDIYAFQWIEPPPPPKEGEPPVVVVPPIVPVISGERPLPTTLQDFLPLALYFDNDEPDKRTLRTATKKTYGESYEKYIRRKDEFLKAYTKDLEGDDRTEAQEAIEGFFDAEVERGYVFLGLFSEILLKRLQAGETVEIFIKGFTSPRAEKTYNLALGKRRISSLRNHFDTWQDGVFQTYLKKGQLKISERSFGEAVADSSVSDALDDLRGSVYSINASRERRVEIVEVKTK